ncbi:uncharacterized protein LOC124300682 [Neodiprion virginianus]|uniref:uncharacterized protein LOC124300682 n=1 Tax=Neodiprion virginianus TaxID=2961670 RepID=UPI001EE740EE|nr:uncharacterized protein LOC124300682 [Neodiprion virginianus]
MAKAKKTGLERRTEATNRISTSDENLKAILAESYEGNVDPSSQPVPLMRTPVLEVIRTLPECFNSMINESIEFEIDRELNARDLIGTLGRKLGIYDYQTNMASFWLLDAIALEVVRWSSELNSSELGILVSWIAGEAKLIQDKQLSRTEFFQEMARLFALASDQIIEGHSMIYWEELTAVESSRRSEQESMNNEPSSVIQTSNSSVVLNDSANHKNGEIAMVQASADGDILRGRKSLNSSQTARLTVEGSLKVHEAIIESTYAMYANAFHYATVSAAFAKTVELHTYKFPYTLRFPRPLEPPIPPPVIKETSKKNKSGKSKEKKKRRSQTPDDIPPPPAPSMTDEEIIAEKRKFILPLKDSIEAPRLLERYAERPPSDNANTNIGSGKKGVKGTKGKRK